MRRVIATAQVSGAMDLSPKSSLRPVRHHFQDVKINFANRR